ncbi:lamin tail domain-containing protein [Chondromyces crocatus]|uniref:LTD domain-containing protein n=1 Tax=Chondromyces crocatus TaxID=52 RepID=A0A0K1E7B0_CHOCO|nr:lamin tail domain-containing protein [Chondromyces crocatus]AKT36750.1 uncharacterized protein CMC5_008710 [Chondromyces crocatus]
MSRRQQLRISWLAPLASLAFLACTVPIDDLAEDDELVETLDQAATVPSRGSATTLDVASWNIEWFGMTSRGPTNETLQLQNARDVIKGADLDLWGVQEITIVDHFNSLLQELPGYAGFLSNNALVTNGSSYYYSTEQKVGIIYKTSAVSIQSAKIILTGNDYEFAGRPPLEIKLTANVNGTSKEIVFITLHAKASNDAESYTRRKNGSIALKSYIDSTHAGKNVMVVGDFNDDLDSSIRTSQPSPYANLVNATGSYFFPTLSLSESGLASTASGSHMLDHHLVTSALQPLYIGGSAEVYRVDQYISSYTSTTSNHYPVIARYSLGSSNPGGAQVFLNEILANEPGSDTNGEFIEIVNRGSTAVNLGGYTLSDAVSVRHRFPTGTSLAAGKALVVFGGTSGIPSGVGNAVAASTGGLALNNGSDTVTLATSSGTVVDAFSYGSALSSTDGVSMNRSPDMDASGSFVLHTTLVSSAASPGRRVNGTAF